MKTDIAMAAISLAGLAFFLGLIIWRVPETPLIIVFTGVYPKPMLSRIEPSVKALIAHVEEKTGFVEPQPEQIQLEDGE